jgi:hypothetical protein
MNYVLQSSHCFLMYLNHISRSQARDGFILMLCCNMTHRGVYNRKYQKNLIIMSYLWKTSPVVWVWKAVRQLSGISISRPEKKLRKRFKIYKAKPWQRQPRLLAFILTSRMVRLPRVSGVLGSMGGDALCRGIECRGDNGKHQMLGTEALLWGLCQSSFYQFSGLWAGSHGWTLLGAFMNWFPSGLSISEHTHTHTHTHTALIEDKVPGPGLDIYLLEQMVFQWMFLTALNSVSKWDVNSTWNAH